jgi:hypothetical protein
VCRARIITLLAVLDAHSRATADKFHAALTDHPLARAGDMPDFAFDM